jgi:hypothetical protein
LPFCTQHRGRRMPTSRHTALLFLARKSTSHLDPLVPDAKPAPRRQPAPLRQPAGRHRATLAAGEGSHPPSA